MTIYVKCLQWRITNYTVFQLLCNRATSNATTAQKAKFIKLCFK